MALIMGWLASARPEHDISNKAGGRHRRIMLLKNHHSAGTKMLGQDAYSRNGVCLIHEHSSTHNCVENAD
jgi:hypothetical protein